MIKLSKVIWYTQYKQYYCYMLIWYLMWQKADNTNTTRQTLYRSPFDSLLLIQSLQHSRDDRQSSPINTPSMSNGYSQDSVTYTLSYICISLYSWSRSYWLRVGVRPRGKTRWRPTYLFLLSQVDTLYCHQTGVPHLHWTYHDQPCVNLDLFGISIGVTWEVRFILSIILCR